MNSKYRPDIKKSGWMSLDNAAKIYPSVMNKEFSNVFRLECRFTSPIRIKPLMDAVEIVCQRFPYYLTTLRQGLFWYFLEYNPNIRPPILADEDSPCIAFPAKRGKNALYRIVVHGNRLSVEFLHILTDGGGAMEFFRSLIVTYLNNCGYKVPYSEGIIDPETDFSIDETEDSFNKYFDKDIPFPDKLNNAWHVPYPLPISYRLETTSFQIDSKELKTRAAQFGVTITEFLISVYLSCLQEIWSKQKHHESPILRVEVPVNMRRKLESQSMRNFSLFVIPEIDLRMGRYDFDEIIKIVHNYMQIETSTKALNRTIARNVKPERSIWIRIVPLFIKSFILSYMHKKHGASKYSGVLTNAGIAQLPREAEKHIKTFHFVPPPPTHDLKVSCGIISYQTNLIITFANICRNKELERKFSTLLIKNEIGVKILNNQVDYE